MRTTVCQLRVKDIASPWGISFAMSATFSEPDEEYIAGLMKSNASAMQEKLSIAQELQFSAEVVQRYVAVLLPPPSRLNGCIVP